MKYLLLVLLLPLSVSSQCRYFDRIFNDVNKTSNVVYGNAPAITSFYISESFTSAQDLKLDIFQPAGDVEPNRALIIFAHSGGFINGSKNNQDMQALSDTFAHYGYVTASMDYRLNFNLLSSNSSERAVWRGIQDASAAVRFFKENAALYNIDPNKIFVWGSSAGAFLALGLAYVDDNERPASTVSSPNLGCKDCSGNSYLQTSKVMGVISCWGATKDTSWLQSNNTTPVQLFHGTNDGTVPIAEGYPFGLPTITYVRGSQQLNEQLNRTTIYHEYYPAQGQDHEYWGTSNGNFGASGPTIYWSEIIGKAKLFMIGRMGAVPSCGPVPITLVNFSGKAMDNKVNLFWNTAAEYNVKTIIVERSDDGVWFNRLTEVTPKGTSNSGATYNSVDMFPLPGTGFYRLKTVNLDGSFAYSKVIQVDMPAKDITITQLYPNPVRDILKLEIYANKKQQLISRVFDISGKLLIVKSFNVDKGQNNSNLTVTNLERGIYIISFENTVGNIEGRYKIVKQ